MRQFFLRVPRRARFEPPICSQYPHGYGRQFDLPYLVEQWDDTDSQVEELIAG